MCGQTLLFIVIANDAIEGLRLQLKGSVKEPNILIYFSLPITQSCSVSDVLFTGGRGVSDFSILKYY